MAGRRCRSSVASSLIVENALAGVAFSLRCGGYNGTMIPSERRVSLTKSPVFRIRDQAGLFKQSCVWNHVNMRGHRIVRLLFAWFVAVGLTVAPLAAPAAALAVSDAAMASMMEDMPCCPEGTQKQSPQPDKCKDCAAMFLCSFNSLQAVVPSGERALYRSAAIAELAPGQMARLRAIDSSPPAPPPRS
jgi:hypothetical protein